MPRYPFATSTSRSRPPRCDVMRFAVAALITIVTVGCSDSPMSIAPASSEPTASASIGALGRAKGARYTVTDLGTLGGPFSIAFDVNDLNRVLGAAMLADGSQHASRWSGGRVTDLGTLGGLNSQASGRNLLGGIAIVSETREPDPLGEDFCGLHSGQICRAARWQNGKLTELPTLGGVNSTALEINNRGDIIGASDDGVADATCIPPQKTRFQAVVWSPNSRTPQKLRPLPGDEVGIALKNNDRGQVVGTSGLCSNTIVSGLALGPHAVLWDHGTPINLGNLGSPENVNVAADINNRGMVIGGASFPDGTTHPFLWTKSTGMRDLGLLSSDPADEMNTPYAINDRGQIVGGSCDATLATCRAYIWQNGTMTDLNDLIPEDSPLYLISPFGLNNEGAIAGLAIVKSTGEAHAFLAVPVIGRRDSDLGRITSSIYKVPLPEGIRALFVNLRAAGMRRAR